MIGRGGHRARLMVAFALVAAAPLLVLAGWSRLDVRAKMAEIQREALRHQATLAANEFEKAFLRATLDLRYLARRAPALRALRRTDAADRSPELLARVASQLTGILEANRRYAAAAYIDEVGNESARAERRGGDIVSVARDELRLRVHDPVLRDFRQRLLEEGEIEFGELMPADPAAPGEIVVRAFTRLFDEGRHGQPSPAKPSRGLIALDVSVDTMMADIRQSGVDAEHLYLVDRRGAFHLAGSEPVALGVDITARLPTLSERLPLRGPQLFPAADGGFAAARPVALPNGRAAWLVVATRPPEAIRAPLRRTERIAAVVFVLALALALALAGAVASRLSKPILRLAAHAVELGHGRFEQRIEVRTGDELERLGDALQRMAAELRELYHGQERRIADKTRELSERNRELEAAYAELQETHRKLKESEAELIQSEKLSSIGRLAASVAHEINNPAGVVSMYAQMLREDSGDDRTRETLDTIVDSADKISATVRGLLDFSRRSPTEPQPVVLADAVASACQDVFARDPELAGRIAVERDVAAELVTSGDREQLAQVFRNLLENAAHAMDAGTVRIAAAADGDGIRVTVDDDGPGIPDEALPRIFEPFFTTKPGSKGTGLGLAVSYGIIRSHHGSIRALNRDQGGARFELLLPAAAS